MGDGTAAEADSVAVAADASLRRRIRRRLLAWFGNHRRDLPWRRDRDPYRIWVSEVMLQQTQAATVARFFEPFLDAFPTLASLAAAEEQDVLRRWEGLGYYRRARDLHAAARELLRRHGGRFPDTAAALQDLPGMGRYTRNAVLSQAFDQRLPILEVNSRRVLCRLFGRRDDPSRAPAQGWLWRMAEALLPRRHVGDFNQALMELGALVCTPATPRCPACPLARDCAALRLGLQDEIPAAGQVKDPVAVREAGVVVYRRDQVLLVQRPPQGRWAGLWEFPHGPLQDGETHEAAAERLAPELTGLCADVGPELLTVRHGIMHYRVTLVCFEARYRGGTFRPGCYRQGRWVTPSELSSYPVSSPQRRLARVVAGQRQKQMF